MFERTTEALLQEMMNSSEDAIHFIAGMDFASFKQDKRTEYAVAQAVGVVGEWLKLFPSR